MPVSCNLEPQEKEDGPDCHGLEFPCRFYGRDAELKRLCSMCKTIGSFKEKQSGESSPLALISGYAGTGKSALVCELRNQIFTDSRKEETGIKPCYFLSGKHDELQGGDLFSALVEAFGEFCNQLLDGDGDIDERGELRSAIRAAAGHESRVLTEIVPDSLRIIGQQKEDIDLNSNKEFDWNRPRCVFKKVAKAICAESRPLILFLDDLQWADEPSLDLVTDLMTDKSLPCFMFVGAFRSNEADDSHPLTQHLAAIENGKKIDRINLADLFYDDIGAFIAGTLNLTAEETEPLTKVACDQTDGNVFHMMQSLDALRREQIIFKSEGDSTWKWDPAKLSLTAAKTSESVVEVVTAKIKTLPEHMQKAW
jgi:predicted ATPase